MTYPLDSDDPVAPLLVPPSVDGASLRLGYKTGRVVSWDQSSGWQVEVDGQTVTVTAVVGGSWVARGRVGDVVGLLSTVDGRGVVTYLVLGPVMTPEMAIDRLG